MPREEEDLLQLSVVLGDIILEGSIGSLKRRGRVGGRGGWSKTRGRTQGQGKEAGRQY